MYSLTNNSHIMTVGDGHYTRETDVVYNCANKDCRGVFSDQT